MNRRLGICLLGLVVTTLLWGTVAAGATTQSAGMDASDRPASVAQPLTTPDEFDNTRFKIRIFENRSAKWTVQHSRPLNDSEVDDFEAYAADFRTRDTTTYTNFRTRAGNLVGFGEDVTGRTMTARQFSRDARVANRTQLQGVVELSFVWTDFAESDGGTVEVGDVFDGGMYIRNGQRVEFRRGPSLAFTEVDPDPDSMAEPDDLAGSESVTWVGEVQFADQRPYAALAPRDGVDGAAGGDADGPPTGEEPNQGAADGMLPMMAAGALLFLVVVGSLAWYRGYLPPGGESRPGVEPSAGDGGTAVEREAGIAGGGGAAAAQVTEEELLSDEDRVLKLLDENGGRMKQVAIVEETDWSKSKVSMLLSDMEEEGQISKLRLGRENIISLAGEEPDAAGSPFEDE